MTIQFVSSCIINRVRIPAGASKFIISKPFLRSFNKNILIIKKHKIDCICLCANCHAITHSRDYKKIATNLFGNEHVQNAKKIKFQIKQNIQNFNYKFHKLKDPLQKEFEY